MRCQSKPIKLPFPTRCQDQLGQVQIDFKTSLLLGTFLRLLLSKRNTCHFADEVEGKRVSQFHTLLPSTSSSALRLGLEEEKPNQGEIDETAEGSVTDLFTYSIQRLHDDAVVPCCEVQLEVFFFFVQAEEDQTGQLVSAWRVTRRTNWSIYCGNCGNP